MHMYFEVFFDDDDGDSSDAVQTLSWKARTVTHSVLI